MHKPCRRHCARVSHGMHPRISIACLSQASGHGLCAPDKLTAPPFLLLCSALPDELQVRALCAAHAEATVAVVGAAGFLDAAAATARGPAVETIAKVVLGAAGHLARDAPEAFSPFLGAAVRASLAPLAQV